MLVRTARIHQPVEQYSRQLICRFAVDGLDVLLCFDWLVNDEIIPTKSALTIFFAAKNEQKCMPNSRE